MTRPNHTDMDNPPSFFLVGIPGLETAYFLLAFPFCLTYLLALAGNGIIFLIIQMENSLHQPMYMLLAMLSIVDMGLSSSTIPKMLTIFWLGAHDIAFNACLTQMFFIHALAALESGLLVAMALDRYVAVCCPLRYTAILTGFTIAKLGLAITARAVVLLVPLVLMVMRLHFCQTRVIVHSYCEHMAVVKLACGDTKINSAYGLVVVAIVIGFDIMFVSFSYFLILGTVFRLPSKDARWKTLGTCSSHVCVILLFYTPAIFSFLTHRFGHGVAPYIRVLVASLYLLIPPALNPIVYAWRTKPIREKILRILQLCKT
ncbi:olfactory receptor 52P1-like [Pantherophis guttatus]|uniref:Olfactory receptor n=1 Tax=Pantherophis guttatus TaxID=94885 RepID=A0A6P9B1G7_PANGU|nr:olfactory receptor 52P1-like [Pantherophis guttatus]